MTDQTFVVGLFPSVVDNSMRKTLVRCQKMAYWKHERGLQPLGGPNIHLSAGRVFAAGLCRARVAHYDDGLHPYDALHEGIRTVREAYDYVGLVPPYCYKTRDRLEAALAFYLEKWPLATDALSPLRLNNGQLALEMSYDFALPVRHPVTHERLRFAGNFDMLALDDKNRLWIVDEKTTGRMGDAWALQWTLDSQLTGYCWMARQLAKEQGLTYEVAGAIIRGVAIQKADYVGMECLELRQSWELDRWYKQVCRDMEHWEQASRFGTHGMALDHACALYNSPCEYTKLCKAHDPERLIEGNYVVKHYDPLNRD